ncbi:protein FAM184A-like isoform X2 [Cimex lectularius]|uniref:G protein gamma domain-containing protein n=1 Tax=Cimex lectularius TaxID=79782 RepID=A0A8I6TBK5_CIMLE|nr:protein FAM184A-like isoform X2 [Cimex lectularius]XP_014241083.1 protein FAM184A-like isoform X2 [Cimex lectularius]
MFNFFKKKKDVHAKGRRQKRHPEPERPPRKTEVKKLVEMGNNYSKLDDCNKDGISPIETNQFDRIPMSPAVNASQEDGPSSKKLTTGINIYEKFSNTEGSCKIENDDLLKTNTILYNSYNEKPLKDVNTSEYGSQTNTVIQKIDKADTSCTINNETGKINLKEGVLKGNEVLDKNISDVQLDEIAFIEEMGKGKIDLQDITLMQEKEIVLTEVAAVPQIDEEVEQEIDESLADFTNSDPVTCEEDLSNNVVNKCENIKLNIEEIKYEMIPEKTDNLKTAVDSESPEILKKNINDSRAKFFDELLGGDRKGKDGEADAKTEPVKKESPSDEEMISLRSIGLIESFPSIREEDEEEPKFLKKKKHVHWADSEEGRCLESYEEFLTPSSSSEDEEVDDDGEEKDVDGDSDEVDEDSLEEECDEEQAEDIIPDDWRQDDEPAKAKIESDSEEESEKDSENEEEDDETDETEEEEQEENNEVIEECVKQATKENLDSVTKPEEKEAIKNDDSQEVTSLYSKLTELQKDLLQKASTLERAQTELEDAYNEADYVKRKVEKLESDLEEQKQRNSELARRLSEDYANAEDRKRLKDADIKIAELEFKVREIRGEKEKLEESLSVLKMERDAELRRVKDALNAALAEKKEQEAKYQKEFETLRTLNSGREVQMLEDFEWKLREVEKLGKKKIAEAIEDREKKIIELSSKLEQAEADLVQLVELKAYEEELKQLKATYSEQRKNLRIIQRKYEDIQVNEMILQEEVNRLRIAIDKEKSAITNLQALHREEISEKDRKMLFKLEYQKNQLNSEWEEKLKRDCAKLKSDLERTFREERMSAVDTAKRLKDQELANQRYNYEKKIEDLKTEIEGYKERLKFKEGKHQMELQKAQTSADREALDMRRQLDKLDMSYQEKIEKLQEDHEKEINSLKVEHEKKIAQCESSLQQQLGTTRTTLELVKQSMQDENQKKIEQLVRKHEQKMAEQWDKWERAKEMEIQELQSSHRKTVELLQLQLDVLRKSKSQRIEAAPSESAPKHSTDLVLVGDPSAKISHNPLRERAINEKHCIIS